MLYLLALLPRSIAQMNKREICLLAGRSTLHHPASRKLTQALHHGRQMINVASLIRGLAVAAFSLTTGSVPATAAAPVTCIVLVHGAWVDGSGWKPVYDILTDGGYDVSIVQIPETSFQDDVAATKQVLDQQTSSCILVGHSYGGSVITEAGVHPRIVGLVYVAAAAPSVGHFEVEDEATAPSVLAKTKGAVVSTADGFTFLNPADFLALFAPDLPREQAAFAARSQVMASAKVFRTPLTVAAWEKKPSWASSPLTTRSSTRRSRRCGMRGPAATRRSFRALVMTSTRRVQRRSRQSSRTPRSMPYRDANTHSASGQLTEL